MAPELRATLYATVGPGEKFKCGGWTGCDEDHEFYEPQEVLLINEYQDVEGFRACEQWSQEAEDKCLAEGTLFIKNEYVIPTVLGDWLDQTSVN